MIVPGVKHLASQRLALLEVGPVQTESRGERVQLGSVDLVRDQVVPA
jgi:hypothetical protein